MKTATGSSIEGNTRENFTCGRTEQNPSLHLDILSEDRTRDHHFHTPAEGITMPIWTMA